MSQKTSQLTINAMLAAMCVVLGFVSIRIGNAMKISLEDLPVIFAGLMYGPTSGALVGGIGIFLYQFFSYGITATTPLWILPFVVVGVITGLIAKKSGFNNTPRQLVVIFLCMELLVMVLNTFAIYTDAKIYNYYTPALILGALAPRTIVALLKGVVLGFASAPVLKLMSRITKNGR
ncbi:MAG: ECF transporter S component [Lachnospiraceae bacterium]|nr:ECF transporter S component [Lachnospiraceae bacterium]